jgi:hypothetical protein
MIVKFETNSPLGSQKNELAKLLCIPCFIAGFTQLSEIIVGTDELDNGDLIPYVDETKILAATVSYTDMDGNNEGCFKLTEDQFHFIVRVMTYSDYESLHKKVFEEFKKR